MFGKKYYEAYVSSATTCCAGEITIKGEFFTKSCGDALDKELKSGLVVYDAAKEASCLSAIQYTEAQCPASGPATPKTSVDCDQVYRGLAAEGAACAGDVECADGLASRLSRRTTPASSTAIASTAFTAPAIN